MKIQIANYLKKFALKQLRKQLRNVKNIYKMAKIWDKMGKKRNGPMRFG